MKKPVLPILTRAESEIMAALWQRERLTVHELVEALDRPVAYTTALTLLRILEQKGYAKHEADPRGGRAYQYLPAVDAGKARRSHVRDLIDRLFDGRAEEVVTGLLEDEQLSRAQLQALRGHIERSLGPERPKQKKSKGLAVMHVLELLGYGAVLSWLALPILVKMAALRAESDPARAHRRLLLSALLLSSVCVALPWLRSCLPRVAESLTPVKLSVRVLATTLETHALPRGAVSLSPFALLGGAWALTWLVHAYADLLVQMASWVRFGRDFTHVSMDDTALSRRIALLTRPVGKGSGASLRPLLLSSVGIVAVSLLAPSVLADPIPILPGPMPGMSLRTGFAVGQGLDFPDTFDPLALYQPEIDACYERARGDHARLVIDAHATFEVRGEDFRVTSAHVPTPESSAFQSCVEERAVDHWTFPPPPGAPPPPPPFGSEESSGMVSVPIHREP